MSEIHGDGPLFQPRTLEEWSEDVGNCLWWVFPVSEPPYCGTPNDRKWPEYHTHWTPIPIPKEPPWDLHRHKAELLVSDNCTIWHPQHGQLCMAEKHYDVTIYHPVRFMDKPSAWKWITDGCLADLQEGLGCLQIGFSNIMVKERK